MVLPIIFPYDFFMLSLSACYPLNTLLEVYATRRHTHAMYILYIYMNDQHMVQINFRRCRVSTNREELLQYSIPSKIPTDVFIQTCRVRNPMCECFHRYTGRVYMLCKRNAHGMISNNAQYACEWKTILKLFGIMYVCFIRAIPAYGMKKLVLTPLRHLHSGMMVEINLEYI